MYYDLLDREVRTETQGYDGTPIYKDTVYNALGQVAKVSRPYYPVATADHPAETPYWIYTSYDALGRVTSQSLPTQASSAGTLLAATNYSGFTTNITQYRDGTALTTTQVKDAIGQMVAVTDATRTATTLYTYDPFGNLLTVTDPASNITSMTYDIRGRKLTMTDPDMGYWQYAYDSVGELLTQIDANGKTTTMTYDSLGRRVTRNEQPEGTTTWTYDDPLVTASKGKLTKVKWPGGNRTFNYDGVGRLVSETTSVGGKGYLTTTAYDGVGRVDTITYPSGFTVRNNYNPYGYLSSVTNAANAASYWNAPVYNAAGQTTAFTLGNGLTTVNQYDPATGLVTGISTGAGTLSNVQALSYVYDTLGNLKTRRDANQSGVPTEALTYDNLNRLRTSIITGAISVSKSVDYNAIGNIIYKSDVGNYAYDPLHKHAVQTAGTGGYTYDANGNQTGGPNGRLIGYTSYNQPTSITVNGKTNSFTYDGDHQRTTQTEADGTVAVYVHPRIDVGAHYEQETHPAAADGSVLVEKKSYLYAGKEVIGVYNTKITTSATGTTTTANNVNYFHKDHLGSVDTITNNQAAVSQRLSYDAWGKRRKGDWSDAPATMNLNPLNHHGFTGHEMLDDVGLINMNGRIYDPTLGRFLQADPTVQSPGNPQTLNRYSYAGNNPVSFTDPSGLSWLSNEWHKWGRTIIAIAAMVFIPQLSWYLGPWANIVGGFAGGLIASGGDFKAGVIGGLTAGVFGMLHGMSQEGFGNQLLKVGAHGTVGGISGVLQGAKFKSGFMAAGFTQAVSLKGGFDAFTTRTGNAIAAAIVGGTASVIGGGKFENGAVTGAFSRSFNDCAKGNCWASQKEVNLKTIDVNIAQAEKMSFWEWVSKVGPYGEWDYKMNTRIQCSFFSCENLGNVNYGATGAAQGLSLDTLQRAAGAIGEFFGTYDSEWGHPWGSFPHGDDPVDQNWIKDGYDYYTKKNK